MRLLEACFLGMILLFGSATASAAELQVLEAKAVATVPGQPVAAAYMVLSIDEDSELVSMSSDAAGRVELHRMERQGDISRMRRIERLALTAGEATRFEPGGLHLMLINLSRPLEPGQQITLKLVTEDRQGRQVVTSTVVPVVKELPR